MSKKSKYTLFLIVIILMLFSSVDNIKAITYNQWRTSLQKVAYSLEKKHYGFESNNWSGPKYYSTITKQSNFGLLKKVPKKLNLKTNHYKLGGFCYFDKVSRKKWKKRKCSKNWWKSMSNCNRCYVADCEAYCKYGESKLGEKTCLATLNYGRRINGKWIAAKNPYQLNKWCKDQVNYNRMIDRDNKIIMVKNYNYNVKNNNLVKRSNRKINCQSYVKYALQRSKIYNGGYLSFDKANLMSDRNCSELKKKLNIYIPEDVSPYYKKGDKTYMRCFTKQVKWLNESSSGKRPLLSYLVRKGYVRSGDIISRAKKPHVEVYMGCRKWVTKNNEKHCGSLVIYGYGSRQVVRKNYSKYGLSNRLKVASSLAMFNVHKDRYRDHHNPKVAMVVRIKNLKY